MSRLAGHVFDVYDDVDGQILRSVFPSQSDLPDFVKTAHHISEDQRVALSDDRFALVLLDEGHKLKKYAMVDKGNTALSVMYLLKQAHLLPPEAVKTAARNLIDACVVWDLEPPELLKTAAEDGASPVSGKSNLPYAKNAKVVKLNFPMKEPAKQTVENPRLGQQDAANDDVDQRTNMSGVPGTNFLEVPRFPGKEKEKTASVDVVSKQKSWRESPYLDVSGWDPRQAAAGEEPLVPQQTLLEGKYPIDGYDQVKTAAAYFESNWKNLPHRDRHPYCVKLAARMGELGMDIPEDVERYGSETYAADVDSYVASRRGYLEEEFLPLVDLLLEKRAQVEPGTFAEALADFDDITGLRWHWDGKVADPWYSTFGPSQEKLAEQNWTYDEVETRIHEDDLKTLAMDHYQELVKFFGETFANRFRDAPKKTFLEQDKNMKLRLARLAMDDHGIPAQ